MLRVVTNQSAAFWGQYLIRNGLNSAIMSRRCDKQFHIPKACHHAHTDLEHL